MDNDNLQFRIALQFYDNQNYEEAVRYYRLAADQDHMESQFNLGVCYENGTGVTQSDAETVRYYRLVADKGHVLAQYNLGSFYHNETDVARSVRELCDRIDKSIKNVDQAARAPISEGL